MKLWVGITDDDWFRFLAEIKPDEVSFWQPSGKANISSSTARRVVPL
jgi:putative restriction endonuclease